MADFREEVRPEAEKAVKTRIILMGIVEAEKIEVSDRGNGKRTRTYGSSVSDDC